MRYCRVCNLLPGALVSLGIGLLAWPVPSRGQDAAAVIDINRELGLAASGLYLNYQELRTDGPDVDTQTGWTPGVGAKAGYMWNIGGVENVFVSANYQFIYGNVTQSDFSPSGARTLSYASKLVMNDIVLEAGKGFFLSPAVMLTPVVQLEYRNWARTISHADLSPHEDYSFFAPGVGMRATYLVAPRLALTGKIGLESMLPPTLYGTANPTYDVPAETLRPGSKLIEQAEFGVDYLLSPRFHVYADMKYSHFEFGQSPSVSFISTGPNHNEHEPNSITNQLYLEIGLAWNL